MVNKQWVIIPLEDEYKGISFEIDVLVEVKGDNIDGFEVDIEGISIGRSYVRISQLSDGIVDSILGYVKNNINEEFEYLISESPQG